MGVSHIYCCIVTGSIVAAFLAKVELEPGFFVPDSVAAVILAFLFFLEMMPVLNKRMLESMTDESTQCAGDVDGSNGGVSDGRLELETEFARRTTSRVPGHEGQDESQGIGEAWFLCGPGSGQSGGGGFGQKS